MEKMVIVLASTATGLCALGGVAAATDWLSRSLSSAGLPVAVHALAVCAPALTSLALSVAFLRRLSRP